MEENCLLFEKNEVVVDGWLDGDGVVAIGDCVLLKIIKFEYELEVGSSLVLFYLEF